MAAISPKRFIEQCRADPQTVLYLEKRIAKQKVLGRKQEKKNLKNGNDKVRSRLNINVNNEKGEGSLMAECNKNKNCVRKKSD